MRNVCAGGKAITLRVQKTVRIDAGHNVMNTRPQELAEILLAEILFSGSKDIRAL